MTQRPWTAAETAKIEQMYDAGASNAEMREALDRSKNSISCKLRTLGLEMGDDRLEDPCTAHLNAIAKASPGYGFPVVTSPVIDILNARERHVPQKREFWRAA